MVFLVVVATPIGASSFQGFKYRKDSRLQSSRRQMFLDRVTKLRAGGAGGGGESDKDISFGEDEDTEDDASHKSDIGTAEYDSVSEKARRKVATSKEATEKAICAPNRPSHKKALVATKRGFNLVLLRTLLNQTKLWLTQLWLYLSALVRNPVRKMWFQGKSPKQIAFLHLKGESNSIKARKILERIEQEFVPIIQRRGYKVQMVAEFTDERDIGLETLRKTKKDFQIDLDEDESLLGYNGVLQISTNINGVEIIQSAPCVIGLRLRNLDGYANEKFQFYSYSEICKVMCHELAHCVHQNHGKAFFKLMSDLEREHAKVVKVIRCKERQHRGRMNKQTKTYVRRKGRRLGDPIKNVGLFHRGGRRFRP